MQVWFVAAVASQDLFSAFGLAAFRRMASRASTKVHSAKENSGKESCRPD